MPARRKSVELSIKKEAIEWIATEGGGVPSRAEAHFRKKGWRISASAFRQWWRNRDQILAASGDRRRLTGGGRHPLLNELENQLLDRIFDKRIQKEKVTREWVAVQAQELFRTSQQGSEEVKRFVASDKWIDCFMKRNDLSVRKRTNLTTLTDDVLVGRAVSFMDFLKNHTPSMNLSQTILMDETAVHFEDSRTHTICEKGARHVVIRSTGFSSMRITVALAVTALGKKLPPSIVWKAKTPRPMEKLGGCYVAFQPRAWVDQELLRQWID